MGIIAMDLGTSNTCAVLCNTTENINVNSLGAQMQIVMPEGLGSELGSIPTILLYEENKPILIGTIAENEFGASRAKENYRLGAVFKPDIAISENAKKYMLDFLTLLRQGLEKLPEVQSQDLKSIVVGVPSQAEENYLNTLSQCLETSGFEEIAFLQEPVGALMNYVATQKLPPARAVGSTLVVDFGGGTCDLALLQGMKTVSNQGDMIYGGRLFDDLFYQILLESKVGLAQELKNTNNDYFVHWTVARRVKEDFSTAIAKLFENKAEKSSSNQFAEISTQLVYMWSYYDNEGKVQRRNESIELSFAEFKQRAGNYKASPELLQDLAGHKQRAGLSAYAKDFLEGKVVDLLHWFGIIVDTVINQHNNIPTVLLTGGSSSWFFTPLLIKEKLGTETKIIFGPEPHSDVAKGIGKFYLFQEQYQKAHQNLKDSLPDLNLALKDLIKQNLDNGISQIYDTKIKEYLQNVILIPALRQFREQGGSLGKLKEDIEERIIENSKNFRMLLSNNFAELGEEIVLDCRKEIKAWFKNEGIPILPESVQEARLNLEVYELFINLNNELWKNFIAGSASFLEFTSVISTAFIAGIVVFLLDPSLSGLTIVSIGGLTFATLFALSKLTGFSKQFKKLCDKIVLPPFARKKAYADEKLEHITSSTLQKSKDKFIAQIQKELDLPITKVLEAILKVVQDELNGLQIIKNIQLRHAK